MNLNPTTSNYGGFGVSCFNGNDGAISANPTGSTGTFSYTWSGPNAFTSTSTSLSNLERGWYYVTLTESNASCQQTDSVLLVSPNALHVTIDNVVDALCDGQANGKAHAVGAGGIQAYSFAWSNGETGINAVALVNGSHTVSITDYNGCESTLDFNIDFDSPAAVVSLGKPDTGFCKDGSVLLNAGGGFKNYIWNTGDVGQLLQVSAMGTFTVTVTNFGGCTGVASINVNKEYDLPKPKLGPNISTPLSSVVLDAGTYKDYLWSTGSFNPTITVTNNGTYSVTVTDFHDCKGNDDIKVNFWPQGLSELTANEAWSIYPNPAKESITLVSLQSITEDCHVVLYNSAGELILRNHRVAIGMVKEQIDISGYAPGVYLIRVVSGSTNWSSTFVKE